MAAEEREDRDDRLGDLGREAFHRTSDTSSHPIGTGVGAADDEEAYWRENYSKEPYYESGRSFDDYSPAYRLGASGRQRYQGQEWTSVEPRLASEWESTRGNSTLNWSQASHASRAAWHRSGAPRSDSEGAAGAVGRMQSAGDSSGDTDDVIDVLQDLVECCKDGEYGFRACADQTKRQDLKTIFQQRADDCRTGAQELNELIRQSGGKPEESGSAMGAMHRGWVAVKSLFSSYDDKAVLAECERGEDNAKARYRKALEKPLPSHIREVVERQMQGVLRNHDQIKALRDSM